MKKKTPEIDEFLLSIKDVPKHIVQAEEVAQRLMNKKLTRKQKNSIKYKAALKNYRTAVTRKRRADTLLQKRYKALLKLVKKFGHDETYLSDENTQANETD